MSPHGIVDMVRRAKRRLKKSSMRNLGTVEICIRCPRASTFCVLGPWRLPTRCCRARDPAPGLGKETYDLGKTPRAGERGSVPLPNGRFIPPRWAQRGRMNTARGIAPVTFDKRFGALKGRNGLPESPAASPATGCGEIDKVGDGRIRGTLPPPCPIRSDRPVGLFRRKSLAMGIMYL
jgi:hypothetical protein